MASPSSSAIPQPIHRDLDPVRAQLGRPRKRGSFEPAATPAKAREAPDVGAAPDSKGTKPAASASTNRNRTAPPNPNRSGRGRAAEVLGDAAAEGVRGVAQNPVGTAFGVTQRVVGAGGAALRGADRGDGPGRKPRPLVLSVRTQEPRLFVQTSRAGDSPPPLLVRDPRTQKEPR